MNTPNYTSKSMSFPVMILAVACWAMLVLALTACVLSVVERAEWLLHKSYILFITHYALRLVVELLIYEQQKEGL